MLYDIIELAGKAFCVKTGMGKKHRKTNEMKSNAGLLWIVVLSLYVKQNDQFVAG